MKDIDLTGHTQMIKQLQLLHDMGARNNNFRSAFQRASKPMKTAARNNAKSAFKDSKRKKHRDSKWGKMDRFKKSGQAYKTYRTKGPIWKAISFIPSRRVKGLYWLGPSAGKSKRFDAYYAFWQERGTSHGIKAQRFMARAYIQYKNMTRFLIRKELYREIYKVAAKRSSL